MKKNRIVLVLITLALTAALVYSQGLPIKSGATSDLATVNVNKAILTTGGKSDVQSYVVGVSNMAVTTTDGVIDLESESGRGFRITKVCIQPGSATAAATVQWQLIRTTAASSGGTVIAAEVTSGNNFLAKMDPADSNWSGVVRTAATEGTSGAILDSGNAFVSITATPPTVFAYLCREYGAIDGKQPIVASGTGNGVKLMWEGTAGGVDFAAQIHFVAN